MKICFSYINRVVSIFQFPLKENKKQPLKKEKKKNRKQLIEINFISNKINTKKSQPL